MPARIDASYTVQPVALAFAATSESVQTMNVPDPDRLEQLHSEIGVRLKRVCAHLPADEFNRLVRQIATVTLRYEDRPPLSTPIVSKAIDPDR